MTRILVLNYEYPPLGGGAATQAKYLAEGLACKGHQVTVLTSRVIGADTVDASTDALEIVRAPSYRGQHGRNAILGMITFASFAFFRLFSLMKKHHPDICICFFGIPCGPIALWLKAIYHAPYVLCLRGGDVPGSNQALEKTHRRIRLLNRLVWREAMQVTVNSKKLKRQARSFYSKIDYQTVLNGIATGRFREVDPIFRTAR